MGTEQVVGTCLAESYGEFRLTSVPGCPLTGQALRYQDGKVWSVGINEVDNNGVEAVYGSTNDGGDGDVVWTVKRK